MCWYWIIPLPWCVWHRYTQRGEYHVKTEAEDGVMYLKTKECQRPPTNHQSQTRGLKQILPHSLKVTDTATTWSWISSLHSCEKKMPVACNPSSPWYFVKVAWVDRDRDNCMSFGFCYEWNRREHYWVLSRGGLRSEWHFKQISLALVLIKTIGRGGKE